ncbi:hypothetical protein B0H10DRAFT_1797556 [Mycena sp. CBHHK59/15]|nr:hypothetical protein B0H10DRAFT_1797556 [Mycena sp. CBHHK59/15]
MNASSTQFIAFKDALARRLLPHRGLGNPAADPAPEVELEDFTSYLALEVWSSLPHSIRQASYESKSSIPADPDSLSLHTTPVSFIDTLVSYGIASDSEESLKFLRKVISDYVDDACAPPPVWSVTRATECEICEREIPLTYHHLIPRSTHSKAVKKKWHPNSMLNSVAWLCRPCHTVVHHVATNEELAQYYYSVELLLQRDDIQRWGRYASKQRFGVRQR